MKKMNKKLMTFVAAMIIATAMVIPAMASKITINRDSSWDQANATEKKATFTYYKIFDAAITEAPNVNKENGASTGGNVVYTISGDNAAEKVAVLPQVFVATLAADGKYYITINDEESTSAEAIVKALEDMVANHPDLFNGVPVTSDANPVVIDNLESAYYLILSSNGQNAAVQTIGDVEINEKNDYPTLDKQQKKKADENYIDEGYAADQAKVNAEIGKVIDYKIIVDIPANANKAIDIIDTMSQGLTYNNDVEAGGADFTTVNPPEDKNAAFQIRFEEDYVKSNQDSQIIITYSATVNENAVIDDERKNTATLKYDEGNYVLTDYVNYTYYFTGIEKIDGNNPEIKLKGVEFKLTVGDVEYKVRKNSDGIYIPDVEGDSTVVTDDDGKIIISGLDNSFEYTLTETKTNDGYNLLEGKKKLTLFEDTGDAYTNAKFDKIENNKGSTLPSTGGMGTTIFYVIGGILVLAAAIILISKRRVQQ